MNICKEGAFSDERTGGGGSGSCGAVVWESTDNLSKSLSGWGGLGVKGGGAQSGCGGRMCAFVPPRDPPS